MSESLAGLKLAIVLVMMCDTISISLMMPILPFIVKFYLIRETGNVTQEEIAEYSWHLEAGFRLAQILGILFMSRLSSYFGCKKIIVVGIVGLCLTSTAISLSQSYFLTFVCRSLNGFFSYYSPLLKGYIREFTNDSNFFEIYTYFNLGISVAMTLGPFLGISSNLAFGTEGSFVYEFLVKNPYFMPFSAMALLALCTLLMVVVFFPESKGQVKVNSGDILKKKEFIIAVGLCTFYGFIQNGVEFLFSIICNTSVDQGGVGIESEQVVSAIQTCAGLFVIVIPWMFQDSLVKKLGLLRAFFILLSVYTLLTTLYPLVFGFDHNLLYASLSLIYGLILSICLMLFSYFSFCISNSVYSDESAMAHGYSNAVIGFTRFLSNAFYGLFYSFTIRSGRDYILLNGRTSIYLNGVFLLILFILSLKLLTATYETKKVRPISYPLLEKSAA